MKSCCPWCRMQGAMIFVHFTLIVTKGFTIPERVELSRIIEENTDEHFGD